MSKGAWVSENTPEGWTSDDLQEPILTFVSSPGLFFFQCGLETICRKSMYNCTPVWLCRAGVHKFGFLLMTWLEDGRVGKKLCTQKYTGNFVLIKWRFAHVLPTRGLSVYRDLNFVAPARRWICYKVNFYKSVAIKDIVLNWQLLNVIIQRAL